MFERLRGLNFLIFGGTSGIGLAAANILNRHGANIAVCSRSSEKLESAFSRAKDNVLCMQGDISQMKDCTDVVDLAYQEMGKLDVVVNAAGVHAPRRKFSELTAEDTQVIFETNSIGVFNAMKASHNAFLKQGYGHFIQVSSAASDRTSLLAGCAYTGSKHAVNGMLKTVSQEVREDNVRVSIVSPGPTETPLVDTRKTPASKEDRLKMLHPDTVAECILFTSLLPREAFIEHMTILPSGQSRGE